MSRPMNVFQIALHTGSNDEEKEAAIELGAELYEKIASLRSNQRTVEDSGLMDNYTDAARARKNIVTLTKEIDELLQKAWRMN